MIQNNFLPADFKKSEKLEFQKEINKSQTSNYFFINKVFESLNTLKNEGSINPKMTENGKKKPTSKQTSSKIIEEEEEEDDHESDPENSIQEEEHDPTFHKVPSITEELDPLVLHRSHETPNKKHLPKQHPPKRRDLQHFGTLKNGRVGPGDEQQLPDILPPKLLFGANLGPDLRGVPLPSVREGLPSDVGLLGRFGAEGSRRNHEPHLVCARYSGQPDPAA